jgi:hypothetical protein
LLAVRLDVTNVDDATSAAGASFKGFFEELFPRQVDASSM